MKYVFTKMHSLGNDFMVMDGITQTIHVKKDTIQQWADRHRGIGFDQCLIIEKSHSNAADFFMRIFNADGSQVGQCGNGTRCMARFANVKGLTSKTNFKIATHSIQMDVTLNNDETVSIQLPPPIFSAPFYDDISGLQAHTLDVGNPHAVILVTDAIHTLDVPYLGKPISEHAYFPQQTNVEFMQILSSNHMALRVYERGCGETSACGSGALAAAAVGIKYYDLDSKVIVSLPGGDLEVQWGDQGSFISQKGSAEFVFEGRV